MNTYYKDQLNKIKGNDLGYPAQVKITKDHKSTHWLSLNDESATAFVEWTKENYNVPEPSITIAHLSSKVEAMYLDWLNNFLTVSSFAEHYLISEEAAKLIIQLGQLVHINQFINEDCK